MSHEVISHSPDLKRLRDEGYEVEVKKGYVLVHHVPYVNSVRQVKYGTLVSVLDLAGDRTTKPQSHVVYFCGEHPCNKDGSMMIGIQHGSQDQQLADGIQVNHSFSNRPPNGYNDYYDKLARYISLIAAPAYSISKDATARTFQVIESDDESVFQYMDTFSSRADIGSINAKLTAGKIGIVGLGGTGSYILDLVSKTPVKEIHLFDGDEFLQHNAFRAPGAAPKTVLASKPHKVEYFSDMYSAMRRGIVSHSYYIDGSNVGEVLDMDFVFICIDHGESKALVIRALVQSGIPFIDVGMGIQVVDESLIGVVRTTTVTNAKQDHITKRISLAGPVDGDDYSTNIQTADLNCLNAAMAVIKWKKLQGFYHDVGREHHTTYTLNTGEVDNHENET